MTLAMKIGDPFPFPDVPHLAFLFFLTFSTKLPKFTGNERAILYAPYRHPPPLFLNDIFPQSSHRKWVNGIAA